MTGKQLVQGCYTMAYGVESTTLELHSRTLFHWAMAPRFLISSSLLPTVYLLTFLSYLALCLIFVSAHPCDWIQWQQLLLKLKLNQVAKMRVSNNLLNEVERISDHCSVHEKRQRWWQIKQVEFLDTFDWQQPENAVVRLSVGKNPTPP